MKLENQVISLEIAKRLKELNVNQFQSYFQWVIDEYPIKGRSYISNNGDEIELGNDRVDAFTVAELGEMLPRKYQTEHYNNGDWYCSNQDGKRYCYADTEADARGKMLIYLLENKLITL